MVEPIITDQDALSGAWRMDRIMQDFPSAHRALLERYGIQRSEGAASAGYQPSDTLATVVARRRADVEEVIDHIRKNHDLAQALEITALKTAQLMKDGKVTPLDVREARAFAVASVPGSRRVDEALAQEIVQSWPKDTPIVLVCHHGMRSLDAADYLQRHGFTNARSLRGGVDAWSVEIDPSVPRY
jgi:rhodanese-related sulfurtransferase